MSSWLVKSEEDVYSIDDLKRDKKTHWHGVRNYQARNYLKAMKRGDTVLFYHSNCETPGVVGVATVDKVAYPDPSQFDKKSEYYDSKSPAAEPRWFCPDIAYKKKFQQTVSLEELKTVSGIGDFQLLKRGNRLSVLPVTDTQLRVIERLGNGADRK